jgi:phospholipid-translocating ATPase
LAFTSLPIIFQGILDQDVDDRVALANPQLYRRGIEQKEWTQVKFWSYMIDGLYQSVISFYFTYFMFDTATFASSDGLNINDYKRLGVYIVNPIVIVVNVYILINTYRWDWFMLLITAISILLVFAWTGIYTLFTAGFTFYGAGTQVYGQLSFWAVLLLTVITCLLPRFAIKSFQKIYLPYDVDIVREQVRQGKFDHLKDLDMNKINLNSEKNTNSLTSSEISKGEHMRSSSGDQRPVDEDMKPIYPPSVAPTSTTHNPRSHNGSDGTEYTNHRASLAELDRAFPLVINTSSPPNPNPIQDEYRSDTTPVRPSMDRLRPSFDRLRSSMDRTRASFEASNDFTSAAQLSRVESSHSNLVTTSTRRQDISDDLRS